MVKTLAEHNMTVVSAARALHYSNCGLRYQLERIHHLTGLNTLNFYDLQKHLLRETGENMNRSDCIARPPKVEDLPRRELWEKEAFTERRYVPDIDSMAWGWVEYEDELTPDEIAKCGLIMQPRR